MKEAKITLPEGCKAANIRVDGNILSYDVIEDTKDMAELNIPAYIARDENGELFLYIRTVCSFILGNSIHYINVINIFFGNKT